jgi:putative hydrolase of the HAD superfamily
VSTAICFDLDGTLLQYDRSHDAVTAATFEDHLGTAPESLVEAYTATFLDAFEALEPDPYRAGMDAALDRARTEGFAGAGDASAEALTATRREREVAAGSVPDAARDCLDTFAADDDVSVAIVTDGVGDWQREKLTRHDLMGGVDLVAISYEVGGHKTDGDPYDHVRDGIDADEYVMVGDSYESDVEAARAAGFVPVHYEDDGADLFGILRAFL